MHLGRFFAPGLAPVLLLLAGLAEAQAPGRGTYLATSRVLAETLGGTWERGRQCGIHLDGLSREAATLLFSRRLPAEGVEEVLRVYEEARRQAAGETCQRKTLDGRVQQADAQLKRYLQTVTPLRIEISSPPPRQF